MKAMRWILTGLLCLVLAGCGQQNQAGEMTPTAAPTVSAELTPISTPEPTATPTPTPTMAPERNYYLFAYFVGEGKNEESIYYAVSEDGFRWQQLNGGEPVLTSYLGEKGLRDPFVMRSADGKKFYMIATDLCINKNGDWGRAQNNGSKSIMVWESEDLVYWSEQRMFEVAVEDAGCTWAPEAFYDETTGEYVVFWASRVAKDNFAKQRMYYATTKNFLEFSEPQIWIDYPYDVIDATVIKEGDTYYRFIKYGEKVCVVMEKSESLLGEWTRVEAPQVEAQPGVEGPTCFKLHEEDVVDGKQYALLLDNFGGGGYYYMTAENLADGDFTRQRTGYEMPGKKARHGTVLQITEDEYNFLLKKLK